MWTIKVTGPSSLSQFPAKKMPQSFFFESKIGHICIAKGKVSNERRCKMRHFTNEEVAIATNEVAARQAFFTAIQMTFAFCTALVLTNQLWIANIAALVMLAASSGISIRKIVGANAEMRALQIREKLEKMGKNMEHASVHVAFSQRALNRQLRVCGIKRKDARVMAQYMMLTMKVNHIKGPFVFVFENGECKFLI